MRGKFVSLGGKLARRGALLLSLVCGAAQPALADASQVKGTVGGAMLGAELVLLAESAIGLDQGWMYLAGGAAGAGAGAYLGHRIGGGRDNQPPAFLLAGGIALIIPTIMGVLTATQYALPDSFRTGDDAAASGLPGDASAAGARLELPNVGLAQAFSRDEIASLGVRRVSELHVMLLRGVF